jgi:hypothetical protein
LEKLGVCAVALSVVGSVDCQAATSPSIEAFAARPRIEDASISPDGRYLALIQTHKGRAAAVVMERQLSGPHTAQPVLGEPNHFQIAWCHWATNTRLLCGFRGMG